MHSGLKISFVNRDEFLALRGVKPESLETDPGNIKDSNLVRDYDAQHSVIKSKLNNDLDDPVYTTRAQACTAGFLRVRVGMEPQSHMMLHLLGIKKDDLSSVERASKALPEKLDDFFSNLDQLIRLAAERNKTIYIDHVAIGSIEESIGQLPEGAQCAPLSDIKSNSGDLRRFIEESVNQKINEIKEQSKKTGAKVDFSESSFTGQTSIFTGEYPEIPMSHMHYDPKTETLSINADYYTQITNASSIHNLNITDAEAISRHYAKVLLGHNHASPQIQNLIYQPKQALSVIITNKGTMGQATGDSIASVLNSYNSTHPKSRLGLSYEGGVLTIHNSSHLTKQELETMIKQRTYSGWFPQINNQNEQGDWQISLSPTPPPVTGLTKNQLKHSVDFATSKDAAQGHVVIAKLSDEITHVRTYGMWLSPRILNN